MKYIEPDSIPELRIFPYIIAFLSGLGLLFAALNKKWMYLSWFVLFLVLAVLGIYDFYLWEYDYGHNLDPMAMIKIEGMAYQPPLFGRKALLNFIATSYPSTGGILMGIGMMLGFLAYWFKRNSI